MIEWMKVDVIKAVWGKLLQRLVWKDTVVRSNYFPSIMFLMGQMGNWVIIPGNFAMFCVYLAGIQLLE